MALDDYLLALKVHRELNENGSPTTNRTEKSPVKKLAKAPTTSIVDPEWEVMDPNPDIHTLFGTFSKKFFWETLGVVEVKWSPKMYMCAGICTYKGKGGCIITLSLPLLKFRPRKDLVETLLHEMIHAYLFVTKNNKDRSSHGTEFCKHMDRINRNAGTNITIYHNFHDEVNHYRTHVWRCNGICKAEPPYFGYVRRAINRAPGPHDFWFAEHKRKCGGSFDKVGEPDNFNARPKKKLKTDAPAPVTHKKPPVPESQKDLRNFFPSSTKTNAGSSKVVTATINKGASDKKDTLSKHGGLGAVAGVETSVAKGSGVVNLGGLKKNIHGFGSGVDGKNDNFKAPFVAFSGKSHVLGSGGGQNDRSKSRLLGNQSSSSGIKNDDSKSKTSKAATNFQDELKAGQLDEFTDLTAEDSSDDDSTCHQNCPVCGRGIKANVTLNEHLDECTQLESVFNSSTSSHTLSDSDSDDASSPAPVSRAPSPPVDCPNCTAQFTPSTINQHLDQCLSFD